MRRIESVLLILTKLGMLVSAFAGKEYESSKDLYNYLMNNRTNSHILPICSEGGKVTVTVDLAFRELIELDQKNQVLCAKIWIRLRWNDCSLQWDPSDFGNLSKIVLPYEKVWTPDITLYEGASKEANKPDSSEYNIWIYNDGHAMYNFPAIITTSCRIDVTYFPFDYQNCSLKFGSWNFNGDEVDILLKRPEADTTAFVVHNEWELFSAEGVRHVLYYECCPGPFPDATYYIVLARRPKFYIITLFLPSIVVSGISLLGFFLPPQSGEKINIQITILLSISVFLLLVQDKLPSSSETFPQLAVYFSVNMVLTCTSCALTVIVMCIYCKQEVASSPPPSWLSRIGRIIMLDFTCRKKPKSTETREIVRTRSMRSFDDAAEIHSNIAYVHGANENAKGDADLGSDPPEYKERETISSCYTVNDDVEDKKWVLLALACDRFFVIIISVAMLVNVITFVAQNWSELGRF